jgi:hypothetical protein
MLVVRIRILRLENGVRAGTLGACVRDRPGATGIVRLGRSVAHVCIELLTLADCKIILEELKKLIDETDRRRPPTFMKISATWKGLKSI